MIDIIGLLDDMRRVFKYSDRDDKQNWELRYQYREISLELILYGSDIKEGTILKELVQMVSDYSSQVDAAETLELMTNLMLKDADKQRIVFESFSAARAAEMVLASVNNFENPEPYMQVAILHFLGVMMTILRKRNDEMHSDQ